MAQSSVAVVTEYAVIQPQTTLVESITPADIVSLRREVALQGQGEAVELFDGMPSVTTALLFAALYDIADEVVFRLKNGPLVLIFDHQPKETLRPKEVDATIWEKILKIKERRIAIRDVEESEMELLIDLVSIWKKAAKHKDIMENTKLFIKSFFAILKPASTIRLQGEIPNLPLLLAVYLVRPYGHTIIFENSRNNIVNLFSKR